MGVSLRGLRGAPPRSGSPSQEGWWSPAPRPFRSGVSARLTPRSGSPSQEGWWSGDPAPRPFRSGVSARLTPRSGSPSQEGWESGVPVPLPSRSGVSARLTPRSGSPSQEGWWSGDPAPRPFRSGVSARLTPRSGVSARLTPRSGVYARLTPRSGSGQRCIPAEPPVMKPTRASSPGGGSSLTRLASRAPHRPRRSRGFHHRLFTTPLCSVLRCVSVEIHSGQFSRWGLLPHAPCQPRASPPPGDWPASVLTSLYPRATK